MAESTCKVLRDGALEGELAPSLTIKDSILLPLGIHVFDYVLSQMSSYILAGKSQSRGIIIVAFSRSPLYYVDLLKKCGVDSAALGKWVRILDCYSDPLGWKHNLREHGQIGTCPESSFGVTVCRDVRNSDKLLSMILELGKEAVEEGKNRFCVAIDSVSELLRGVPLSSVAALLSNIRSNAQVSSAFWLLHSDLHNASTNATLEYMCSIMASIEGLPPQQVIGQNARNGKLRVRLKRRNGRVRLMVEDICIEQSGVRFLPASSEEESVAHSLIPKLQFNLQLSEKEQLDRLKVVLPFEHQEKDRANQIYDGRRSGKGKIVYFRDSDDERPDSDEDPDDDLEVRKQHITSNNNHQPSKNLGIGGGLLRILMECSNPPKCYCFVVLNPKMLLKQRSIFHNIERNCSSIIIFVLV